MALLVDTDIPAGNALIESVRGDVIRFRPDCRDTIAEPWFYWHLRVRGCAGRRLRFELTVPHALTVRGAAVSADEGWTWNWIRDYDPGQWSFAYDCGDADVLHFSLGMPYTQRNQDRWLARHAGRSDLSLHELCRTRQGRPVPWFRVGRHDGGEAHQVLIAARHHCCEMMASYELEGLLDAVLADDGVGQRLRESCSFLVVPMVDLDGVEAGDQGKRRHPHDHNGDYIDAPLYPETAAIRRLVQTHGDERLRLCLDLHCPWVRGKGHEHIYIVGSEDAANAARQRRLAAALEAVRTGPLPYRAAGTLTYGQDWNVRKPESTLVPFSRWMIAHAPGTPTVATIELPYASADEAVVTASSARAFGRDVALALASLTNADAPGLPSQT